VHFRDNFRAKHSGVNEQEETAGALDEGLHSFVVVVKCDLSVI